MEFSDVLGRFDIKEVFVVENRILGQTGYLFHLHEDIAYLFEQDNDENSSILYINSERLSITKKEQSKLLSILRMNRLETRKLRAKDLRLYSRQIEEAMNSVLEDRPDLLKGSSHMAFSPKNYTRFSENLLFDFDYIYDDLLTAKTIMEFDEIFDTELRDVEYAHYDDKDKRAWNDSHLYRYLLELIRTTRESINGQISVPKFVLSLMAYVTDIPASRIALVRGPEVIILKSNENLESIFIPKRQGILDDLVSRGYRLLTPDRLELDDILDW